jgi:4-diphosphocytidyl-2-C-methyl-D-erythritol kinase
VLTKINLKSYNIGTLVVKTPAKVNLGLYITGKRPNGYHELCSIFLPLELHDELVVSKNPTHDTLKITVSGPFAKQCPTDEKNIVFKIYDKLRGLAEKAGGDTANQERSLGLDLHITKNIPAEAGLGGGSSNAAGFLTALNQLWGLNLSQEELKKIGSKVGADVPFFIDGLPALIKGIGDIIRPFKLKRDYWAVVIKPSVGLSTALVYKGFTLGLTLKTQNAKCSELLESLSLQGLEKAEELGKLSNDLESVSSVVLPEIRAIRDYLHRMNPVACMMSGSGSGVFALFEEEPKPGLLRPDPSWFLCTTKVLRG